MRPRARRAKLAEHGVKPPTQALTPNTSYYFLPIRHQPTSFSFQPLLTMPIEERIGVGAAFQERHPRLYAILCQLLIAITTFYCALTIARYGPELDPSPTPAIPGILPRNPSSDANSTIPHICPNGAREDLVDFGPMSVLIIPLFSSPQISVRTPPF